MASAPIRFLSPTPTTFTPGWIIAASTRTLAGVEFIFADERVSDQHIMAKILRGLNPRIFRCLTLWNPNVTLELGMAYALDAPLAQRAKGRPQLCALSPHFPIPLLQSVTTRRTTRKRTSPATCGAFRGFNTMSKLGDGLVALLDQQYPREHESLEEHTGRMRGMVARLLGRAGAEGLSVVEISEMLQCNKRMARLIVEDMMEDGEASSLGKGRGMRYVMKPR